VQADELNVAMRVLFRRCRRAALELQAVDDVANTVRQGNRLGCWNTIARSRPGFAIGRPSRLNEPPEICTSPSTAFKNVVLPQPDGPTIDRNSPARTSRLTPSTARNGRFDRSSQ
jgi:hypothetical protein